MRRKGESGQVLPLIAICLAVLMGFGGMGVDISYWRYQQREQQSAADAAALGGAQQLIYSSCPNSSAAATAAKNDASNNGFTDGVNGVKVVPNNPPTSGAFANNNCAVNVQITSSKVPTFFTRLFGRTIMNESTQATAAVVYNGSGCVYMLGTGDNTNFNSSSVQAPKCSIFLNGSANFNGSTVDAGAIGEANFSGSNNGGTFTGATPTKMLPVADPCPEITACAYLTSQPPSTSPCNAVPNNGVLGPGCYNNLNLHGQTVRLVPSGGNSTFVFAGSANFNGASISGTGVTIYIPAGASINFNKVGALNLSAPQTGNNAGVAFYQVPSNSSDVNLNGSNTTLSGLIYAPSAQMNYNGAVGGYTVLVAQYVNFNNSSTVDFGAPPTNASIIPTAVILQ